MGCGASKVDPEAKHAAVQNDRIEKQLRNDKRIEQRTVKILLLGTREFSCKFTRAYADMDMVQVQGNPENPQLSSRCVYCTQMDSKKTKKSRHVQSYTQT